MKDFLIQKKWECLFLGILTSIVLLTLAPYQWNSTELFHMDKNLAVSSEPLPHNFVILDVPAYDGAQYYQIARNIPSILEGVLNNREAWMNVVNFPPSSYGYQRILLPALAWILSLGQTKFLSYAFLFIELASLIGTFFLIRKWKSESPLAAFALAFSPAAMVGLHFSLAEPLFLLLTTLFLCRFLNSKDFTWIDIFLLASIGLTREIGGMFIVMILGYSLLRKQWKSALYASIGLMIMMGWHTLLYEIFHELPFFMSAGKSGFFGSAMVNLILGKAGGYNYLTLSSIPLALFVVLPAFFFVGRILWKQKFHAEFLPLATLGFLLIMIAMPVYIWGSITSIGRVITPIYPLVIMTTVMYPSKIGDFLQKSTLLIGIIAALGLMLSVHPYHLAS